MTVVLLVACAVAWLAAGFYWQECRDLRRLLRAHVRELKRQQLFAAKQQQEAEQFAQAVASEVEAVARWDRAQQALTDAFPEEPETRGHLRRIQ